MTSYKGRNSNCQALVFPIRSCRKPNGYIIGVALQSVDAFASLDHKSLILYNIGGVGITHEDHIAMARTSASNRVPTLYTGGWNQPYCRLKWSWLGN